MERDYPESIGITVPLKAIILTTEITEDTEKIIIRGNSGSFECDKR